MISCGLGPRRRPYKEDLLSVACVRLGGVPGHSIPDMDDGTFLEWNAHEKVI